MAGPRVPGIGPDGAPITLPAEKAPELAEGGGRVISREEAARTDAEDRELAEGRTVGGIASDYGDSIVAGMHASQRGMLEAVGVPLDRGITGVADLFGGDESRKSTAAYLKGLDERHPTLTATTGLIGNISGAIGAAAALRVPGGIGAAPMAGARGVAARMAVGGVENVIQATTKDVNEAALGDKAVNSEMLVANMPKHFLVGGLIAGTFEGGAHVLGKGVKAITARAVPALETGASKAVGRELGMEGAEGLEAGARVRDLNGGEVPTSRKGIADILTGEQSAQRARSATEATGVADALAGAQTTEAALMAARQEAARKGASGAGRRGVAAAETDAAEGAFEAAAEGGAGVERAELEGAARRAEAQGAHAAAGEEALGAGERSVEAQASRVARVEEAAARAESKVSQVADHYVAVKSSLEGEHAAAQQSLRDLASEQAHAAEQLRQVIKRIGDGSDGAGSKYVPRRTAEGHATGSKMQYAQRPPRVGDLDVETGEIWTAERLAEVAQERAASTGSESINAEATRLAAIHDSLRVARDNAEQHLTAVTEAMHANELEAKQAIVHATKQAKAEVVEARGVIAKDTSTKYTESTKAMSLAREAAERVKKVEAETAAFVEKARGQGEGAVAKAEKRGAARIESAKADAAAAMAKVEEGAKAEKAALSKTHEAQTKKLPAASEKTDVDPLIEGMTKYQEGLRGKPMVSSHAMLGAGMSLLHGNPVAAAGAMASSFAAGQARNHGNLIAARTMRGLSQTLSHVDAAIRDGAADILSGTAGRAVKSATNDPEPSRKEPTFEELSKKIIDAQANPLELEHRVREAVGHIALEAPGTYQEILATTQRAHAFLLSILPLPQRDPGSLTPHLEPGDVSATAQYEFMAASRTIDDPLSIFADVKDGSITQTQVNAIATVYPRLFDKMRAEVRRQTMYLTSPVDYEREIHVGVLLGQVTNQVLEPDFQALMRSSYDQKNKKAESINAGGGGGGSGSKTTKNMMSGSESIEGGNP